MKAKALSRKSNKTGYKQLVSAISQINSHMVRRAVTVANQALLLRNWTIGAYIVEYEQEGSDRAKYGERLMERLAEDLAAKGLKGLDERSLRDCRTAYMTYPQIRGSLTPELTEHHALPQMSALMSVELEVLPPSKNSSRTQKPIRGSLTPELPTPLPSEDVLSLSWTKIQELIRISDPWKRAFFENECLREDWSSA